MREAEGMNDELKPPAADPIVVPPEALAPETVHALIEEFVTRSGTDYGWAEASLEKKVRDVQSLLKRGEVEIVYDPNTESCDLREAARPARRRHAFAPEPGPGPEPTAG